MMLTALGRGRCVLEVFAFLAGALLVQTAAYTIASALLTSDDDRRIGGVVAIVAGGIFAVALAVAVTRSSGLSVASLGFTTRRVGVDLLLGLGLTPLTFAAHFLGVGAVWFLWPAGFAALERNPENISAMIPPMGPAALAGLTLVVALWEEVAFRGFVLPRLRRLTGNWAPAVLLSGLAFALLHATAQAAAIVIPLFLISILWSVATIRRRSLVPAIAAHWFFNFIMFLGARFIASTPS